MRSRRLRPSRRPLVEQLESRSLLAVWPVPDINDCPGISVPVPNNHEMSFGFAAGHGDPTNPAVRFFHAGIDILVDGSGGQSVVAARTGTLHHVDPAYVGGSVVIRVPVAGGDEYDVYGHVSNIAVAGMALGTTINECDPLGTISQSYFASPGSHHLHFAVYDNYAPGAPMPAPPEDNLNPFLRLAPSNLKCNWPES